MSPWPRPVSPIGHGEWRRVAKLSVTVSAIHPRFPPTAPLGSPTRPPEPPYRPEVARPSCTPRADPLGPVRAGSGENRATYGLPPRRQGKADPPFGCLASSPKRRGSTPARQGARGDTAAHPLRAPNALLNPGASSCPGEGKGDYRGLGLRSQKAA